MHCNALRELASQRDRTDVPVVRVLLITTSKTYLWSIPSLFCQLNVFSENKVSGAILFTQSSAICSNPLSFQFRLLMLLFLMPKIWAGGGGSKMGQTSWYSTSTRLQDTRLMVSDAPSITITHRHSAPFLHNYYVIHVSVCTHKKKINANEQRENHH